MIVNVQDNDITFTQQNIVSLEKDVDYVHQIIRSRISSSVDHAKYQKSKLDSKISNYKKKLVVLSGRLKDAKKEIEIQKRELDKFQQKKASIQRQLSQLTPPHEVQKTDSDGNTYTTISDPDAGKRSQLERELSHVKHQIDECCSIIKEKESRARVLESDVIRVEDYLKLLDKAESEFKAAEESLKSCKACMEQARDELMSNVADVYGALEEMQDCLKRFESHRYSSAYSNRIHISIPALGGGVSAVSARRPKMTVGATAPSESKSALPEKLKLVSAEESLVEIVGVYTDRQELAGDLKTLEKLYLGRRSICITKQVSKKAAFAESVKDLSDFICSFGYKPRLTNMDTRYCDARGRIYFI